MNLKLFTLTLGLASAGAFASDDVVSCSVPGRAVTVLVQGQDNGNLTAKSTGAGIESVASVVRGWAGSYDTFVGDGLRLSVYGRSSLPPSFPRDGLLWAPAATGSDQSVNVKCTYFEWN